MLQNINKTAPKNYISDSDIIIGQENISINDFISGDNVIIGTTSSGTTSSGTTSSGTTSSGTTSSGATSSGATSSGATSSGATSSGATSSGATSSGATSSGATSSGTKLPEQIVKQTFLEKIKNIESWKKGLILLGVVGVSYLGYKQLKN